jgi:hypothetical protein
MISFVHLLAAHPLSPSRRRKPPGSTEDRGFSCPLLPRSTQLSVWHIEEPTTVTGEWMRGVSWTPGYPASIKTQVLAVLPSAIHPFTLKKKKRCMYDYIYLRVLKTYMQGLSEMREHQILWNWAYRQVWTSWCKCWELSPGPHCKCWVFLPIYFICVTL